MHPLHLLAIGYIVGLLTGGFPLDFKEGETAYVITASLALSFFVLISMNRRIQGKARGAVAALLVLIGLVASFVVPTLHRQGVPAHHLLRHIPYGRLHLTGRLSQPVERNKGASRRPRIYLSAERAVIRGVEIPMTGIARLTLASPLSKIPQVGDRLLVRRVHLRRPPNFKNPGGFDYREFLRLRGVHAVGYASVRNVHVLETKEKWNWRRRLFQFRDNMSAHIRSTYSIRVAGLIETITIGLREEIDPELKTAFRKSGAAHLLAISGLHVGFIAAFFFFSLRGVLCWLPPPLFPLRPFVLTPTKVAVLGAIPLVILFALLSGARISTTRAAIMIVAYLLTRLLERPAAALHSITLAALLILLIEPGFIWDVGFQLSFVATSAIILAADRLPRGEARRSVWDGRHWGTRARQLATIQVVVTAAITPLTALHFQEAHPIGLLVNFLLIPVASLLVPLSFVATAAAAISPSSVGTLLMPAAWISTALAEFMILVSTYSAKVPWGSLSVPKPSTWLIILIFFLLSVALCSTRARSRKGAWVGVCGLTFLLLLPQVDTQSSRPGHTTLLLPDAGGVDAFFLRLPDGKGFAVDGSGRRSVGGFNVWRNVLAPLMRRENELTWHTMLYHSRHRRRRLASSDFAAGVRIQSQRRIEDLFTSDAYRRRAARRNAPLTIWRMAGGETRVSLRFWRKGAMGFEVKNRYFRWLLMLPSRYPVFDVRWFSEKRYDLVRLPENFLREPAVLNWLEARTPEIILAAPQSVRRIESDLWRRIRKRQKKLGIYRPWRGGMLRVKAEPGAVPLKVERFRVARAWPESGEAHWSAFHSRFAQRPSRPAERKRRFNPPLARGNPRAP